VTAGHWQISLANLPGKSSGGEIFPVTPHPALPVRAHALARAAAYQPVRRVCGPS